MTFVWGLGAFGAWALVAADASGTIDIQTPGGLITGLTDGSVNTFKGIRYATAPRFEAAQLVPHVWNGSLNATEFGAECIQPHVSDPSGPRMDEDCLHINVWAPGYIHGNSPLPVLYWIHGGSFEFGAGSDRWFDGTALASSQNVVVVTINYRLGPLGFLPVGEGNNSVGNGGLNGLHDAVVGLQWVQQNIGVYGGDPAKVTIAGESAGSLASCALSVSPLAKGLFRRAVLMSGACNSPAWRPAGIAQAAPALGAFLQALNLSSVAALKRLPATDIIWPATWAAGTNWVDGGVVPEQPAGLYRKGMAHPEAMVLGATTRDGISTFLNALMPAPKIIPTTDAELAVALTGWFKAFYAQPASKIAEITALYTPAKYHGDINPAASAFVAADGDYCVLCPMLQLADMLCDGQTKTFSYVFAALEGCDVTLTSTPPLLEFSDKSQFASHASGIPLLFGVEVGPNFLGSNANQSYKAADVNCRFTANDRALSTHMMDFWGSFLRDGSPSAVSPLWEGFCGTNRSVMLLAKGAAMGGRPEYKQDDCNLWSPTTAPAGG